MQSPEFWHHDGRLARALAPLGWGYALAGRVRRHLVRPVRAPVPLLCVGNLSLGGTGKTPTAIALARRLQAHGITPHVLTRGYGGRVSGPLLVDPARHEAAEVGDEPLLLAGVAPTWVSRDRPAGARAACAAGAEAIVMDDGFQNPSLLKDLSLIVIDGERGLGNGRVMPAGPLREPAADGLARASAILCIGPDRTGIEGHLPPGLPCLRGELRPGPGGPDLAGRPVVAFAGIGRPAKLFRSLEALGARLVETHAFADHHPYRAAELLPLLARAEHAGALCVTTSKDAVRLPAELRQRVTVLPVELAWADPAACDRLLAPLFPSRSFTTA